MLVDLVQLHEWMCTDFLFGALSLDFPARDGWIKNIHSVRGSCIVYTQWLQESHVFSEYFAPLWASFEMCTHRKQSVMTHALTHLLHAWVELMTNTTCANCSSIIGTTQQHLAREYLWPIASWSDKPRWVGVGVGGPPDLFEVTQHGSLCDALLSSQLFASISSPSSTGSVSPHG